VLDGIPESIVIGGSLATGGAVSLAMVAAAFISNVPEAVSATTGLTGSVPRRSILAMWSAIVVVSAAAAALSYQALREASARLSAFVQAFAAGAMLPMLADTMMPEAFGKGGKLVGLVAVLGFSIAVWISYLE
jgi:ZIP family zinc transporter